MTHADLIYHRLINQQISATPCQSPQETVASMIAMQAQEFAQAKWAIGLRLPGTVEADIDNAFNSGAILRTHLLRPTWHFVSPEDIRWLLKLTAPNISKLNAYYYKKFELDPLLLNRCNDILVKELTGGNHITRTELNKALAKEKIIATGLRLSYIFMQAELDGIICSGPRHGNQFTYALLDERVIAGKNPDSSDAIYELTNRYFTSRGPATLQDFVAWSGIAMKDAREGIASLSTHFIREKIDGREYIFAPVSLPKISLQQSTFLMPDYDEYGMGYKNRDALFIANNSSAKEMPVYKHMLVIDGIIGGTWQSTIKNKQHVVEISPYQKLNTGTKQAVDHSVKRYCQFVNT